MDQAKRSAIEVEARENELHDFKAQNEMLKTQVRELKAEIARNRRRRATCECSSFLFSKRWACLSCISETQLTQPIDAERDISTTAGSAGGRGGTLLRRREVAPSSDSLRQDRDQDKEDGEDNAGYADLQDRKIANKGKGDSQARNPIMVPTDAFEPILSELADVRATKAPAASIAASTAALATASSSSSQQKRRTRSSSQMSTASVASSNVSERSIASSVLSSRSASRSRARTKKNSIGRSRVGTKRRSASAASSGPSWRSAPR